MRFIFMLFFCTVVGICYCQDTIQCRLYNFNTKRPIEINKDKSRSVALIGNDRNNKRRVNLFKVDKLGCFFIPVNCLDSLMDNFTFSVIMFHDISVGNDNYNYADFEIRNLRKNTIQLILSEIYLIPAYWSIDEDNYAINVKRTFKRKTIKVQTNNFTYVIRRIPENIKGIIGDQVKYVVDLEDKVIF